VTCLVDLYRPNVGFAALKLLEQGGCRVTVPSGSCAGMLRDHYPELFADDPEWLSRAQEFSARVYELTQFLVDVLEVDSLDAGFNHSVTYHDSCSSLREMGVRDQPRKLLDMVDGVSVTEMANTEVCCGFGGTFCVKYPEISESMVTDKVALARQTGAEVLLAGDTGCLLNIAGRLKRLEAESEAKQEAKPEAKPETNTDSVSPMRVYHVAEVLAGMADGAGMGDPES